MSTDLRTWAGAEAWNLQDDSPVSITDVNFDFEPNTVTPGSYPVTFATKGRVYKVEVYDPYEEGDKIALNLADDSIHVMHKSLKG
ncbi:MAG: hypothetical protein II602_05115 [Erysipelotrichales bacterium]|nr:hypothetical protein [Erysipelotrichales bacterium]